MDTVAKATYRRRDVCGAFIFRGIRVHQHHSGVAGQQAGVALDTGAGSWKLSNRQEAESKLG